MFLVEISQKWCFDLGMSYQKAYDIYSWLCILYHILVYLFVDYLPPKLECRLHEGWGVSQAHTLLSTVTWALGALGSFCFTHHLSKMGRDWVLELLFAKLPIHSEVGDVCDRWRGKARWRQSVSTDHCSLSHCRFSTQGWARAGVFVDRSKEEVWWWGWGEQQQNNNNNKNCQTNILLQMD